MQEQKEASQETEEEPKKSLFIIKSDKYGLINAENYLKNREWELGSSDDLRQAMVYILNKKPTYVMVTVDHSNSKVDQLPKLLMQTFPVKVIVFAESHSSKSLHKLRSLDHPYTLMPPISGPMIERMVNKINLDEERKKNQSPEDEKKRNSYYNQNDSDVISIKNSNKDNGSYHQRFGSNKSDNSKVVINQDKNKSSNANIGQDAKKSDSRGNSNFAKDKDDNWGYNENASKGKSKPNDYSQNSKDKDNSNNFSKNSNNKKKEGHYNSSDKESEDSYQSQKAKDKKTNALSSKEQDKLEKDQALTKQKNDKKDSNKTNQDGDNSKESKLSQKNKAKTAKEKSAQQDSEKTKQDHLNQSGKKSAGLNLNEKSDDDKENSNQSKAKNKKSQNTLNSNNNKWKALDANQSGTKKKAPSNKQSNNKTDENSNSLENPFSRQNQTNNTNTGKENNKDKSGALSNNKNENKNSSVLNKDNKKGTDHLNQNNNSQEGKANNLSNFRKNKKGAGLYRSVLEQATQEALNTSTEYGNKTEVPPLEENSNFSCISVNSQRYNGYLLAAGSSDNHLDEEFIKKIKTRVMDFLESKGEHIYDQNDLDINVHKINYSEWGEEEAEFFRRSIHQGEEIGMAFFESQEVKHPLFIREDEDMLCLSIDSIFEDMPIEFDLYIYLKKNEKYVKITKQGGKLFSDQKQKLLSSGFKEMHVPVSQKENLVKYRAQNFLNENIKNYLKKKKSS